MDLYRLLGRFCALCCVLLLQQPAWAQYEEFQARMANLRYETGTVTLPRANAQMEIPAGWKYLALEQIAGAFEVSSSEIRELDELGYLLPATLNITDENAWWVSISTFSEGYISMDTARIEPYALTWRTRDVYRAVSRSSGTRWEFVNYGLAPVVDTAQNLCLWTERLRYPDDNGDELLDVYGLALGRRGGIITEAEYIPNEWQDSVESAVDALTRSIRFNIGERYSDHSPGDAVADYELSHIITGEFWLGPQTWAAWLKEPVKLKLGKGWKSFKIDIPNWAFWGGLILISGIGLMLWMRGSGSGGSRSHVNRLKGARR